MPKIELEYVYDLEYQGFPGLWKLYGTYPTKQDAFTIGKRLETDGLRIRIKKVKNHGYI